ncbi:hypothetical protein ScPMuIL_009219, partial [Solemya velum]
MHKAGTESDKEMSSYKHTIISKKRFIQELFEERIHLHLLDLIQSLNDHHDVIEVAIRLLTSLNKHDCVKQTLVWSGFVSGTLLPYMLQLPHNAELQYSGFKILYML